MIDLEMMGPPPLGAICTIGLVRFNRYTGEIGRTVHLAVKLQSAVDVGMKMDPNTVVWWAWQDPDAGRALVRGQEDIKIQLEALCEYFTPEDTVWGMPIGIDLVLLRKAFELCSIPAPWHTNQERCLSKLKKQARASKRGKFVTGVVRVGTHHNAEDDALTQALQTCDIIANTNIRV